MKAESSIRFGSSLDIQVRRRNPGPAITLMLILSEAFPHFGLSRELFIWRLKNLRHFLPGLGRYLLAKITGVPTFVGAVYADVVRKNGQIERLGLVSLDIVTTAGVNYIAARMANSSPSNISLFNFHGLGTGNTAAAIGDTALQTELTTQYNPDSTRATGAQSNPSANIYQSAGTNTVDATVAITEWGLLTQAATGGGTLLDRMVFSTINLVSGDGLTTTFQLTLTAGS